MLSLNIDLNIYTTEAEKNSY